MKQIELIEIKLDGTEDIFPHPRQEELYDDSVDANFIESIKLHGIKQMPVVTYLKDIADGFLDMIDPATTNPDSFVIISGHRRISAAMQAGLETITCELKHYDNYFDSEVDHIIYNKQRVKTKKEIAGELIAYKQKLDQIRKELADNGLKAVEKYKSFNLGQHVKVDENGRHYLPFATELIEKELGISEKHQKQYNVIFNDDWLQDKIEEIGVSNLSKKKKADATKQFTELVESGRTEVDKKDGLSINKVYTEITRVWKDIGSIINPKSRDVSHTSRKKKSTSKVWLKPKDFVLSKVNIDSPEGEARVGTQAEGLIYSAEDGDVIHIYSNKSKEVYTVSPAKLYSFLKEQT